MAKFVEALTEQREAQHMTFERYRHAALTDQAADHAIMTMYREGLINVQRIADVEREWQEPSFDYEAYVERSAWHSSSTRQHMPSPGRRWPKRISRQLCIE